MARVIYLAPDNPSYDTMTVNIGKAAVGLGARLEDAQGQRWYGVVGDDGIALLIRSDLLPKK